MPVARSVTMITMQKRVLHTIIPIIALIALVKRPEPPPPMLIHLTQLYFEGTLGSCSDRSFVTPRICRQRSRAKQRCAVALATFCSFEGRALAVLREKLLSRLVDGLGATSREHRFSLQGHSLGRRRSRKPQRYNDDDRSVGGEPLRLEPRWRR